MPPQVRKEEMDARAARAPARPATELQEQERLVREGGAQADEEGGAPLAASTVAMSPASQEAVGGFKKLAHATDPKLK